MKVNKMKMTNKQYRDALDKLDITQVGAGELFQVGARTSRRWALDEARVPTTVAMILHLMLDKKLKLEAPVPNEDAHRIWMLSAKKLE
jgi:hypothetical protein